jgi:hypothetical protein
VGGHRRFRLDFRAPAFDATADDPYLFVYAALAEVSMVLFGDRCPPGALRVSDRPGVNLDDESGAAYLNRVLEPYEVHAYPPRSQRVS